MLQQATIIAGFAGVGKSFFVNHENLKPALSCYTFADLDSTPFSHPNGKLSPDFPRNYIAHIKSVISDPKLVLLIGVHDVVRDQLVANGLRFTLVYPEREQKSVYIQLYKDRGSPMGLVNKLDKEWDNFITSVQEQKECTHVILKPGQHLSDVIEGILTGA